MAPLLSIVTPCKDAAAFLPRALGSVAGQPVEPGTIEHIIMDGGSADRSPDLIEAHAKAHPALVTAWRSGPDAGQSDAINQGFTLARGQYGGWLNADDWYEPGALPAVAAALRADPAIDVLVGRCRFVDQAGQTIFQPSPPEPITAAHLCHLKTQWFNGRSLVQPEVFFRLSLFREVGGLNIRNHYSMDHELWLALLERGARFAAIDVPLACLGVHPGQKTRDNRAAVRSLLVHTADFVERNAPRLADEAASLHAELDSIRSKLQLADLAIQRWDAAARGTDPANAVPAAAAYDEVAFGAGETGRHLRELAAGADAIHAASSEEAVRLAARRAPAGALRILALTHGGGRAPAALLRLLHRRPLGISIAAFSESGLSRALAAVIPHLDPARHRIEGSRIGPGTLAPPGEGEAFEVILADAVLTTLPGSLPSLWAWVAPGGLLVQLADPRPAETLDRYLAWLRQRLATHLSTNDHVNLDPSADAHAQRLLLDAKAEEEARAAGAAFGPDLWLVATPGCRGVDVEGQMAGLRDAEQMLARRNGGLGFHPLAPWPFVGPADLNSEGWVTSVWRKRPPGWSL